MTDTPRSARARLPLSLWVVAVALPLIAAATAVAIQLAWLPQLPDPIATHWSGAGPDGFGPAWSTTALTAGLAVGLTAMFAAFLATARGVAPTAMHKILAVGSLVVTVFLCGSLTATVGVQRGLPDARDAPEVGGLLLVFLGISLVVGVIAWFALPKAVASLSRIAPAEPLPLVAGERSAWIATTHLHAGAIAALLVAVGVAGGSAAFAVAVGGGAIWPIALVPLLLLVLCAAGISWRVRVDSGGIVVRSQPLGWPRIRIPVGDIARVETSEVEPLSEFGGWGWRWAPGRSFGVIARRGPAIEVVRHDGRRFTVTVDDAETGAALLAGYVAGTASRT